MLSTLMNKRCVYQQKEQWYVLDDEFSWNVELLRQSVFDSLQQEFDIPVVFCDSCEANKLVSELGEEESEWLQFASGLYWREVGIVFIFRFDEFYPLVETIFHELRHVLQDQSPYYQKQFELDKKKPYELRATEQDAFLFASLQLDMYKEHIHI